MGNGELIEMLSKNLKKEDSKCFGNRQTAWICTPSVCRWVCSDLERNMQIWVDAEDSLESPLENQYSYWQLKYILLKLHKIKGKISPWLNFQLAWTEWTSNSSLLSKLTTGFLGCVHNKYLSLVNLNQTVESSIRVFDRFYFIIFPSIRDSERRYTMPEQSELPRQKGKQVITIVNAITERNKIIWYVSG